MSDVDSDEVSDEEVEKEDLSKLPVWKRYLTRCLRIINSGPKKPKKKRDWRRGKDSDDDDDSDTDSNDDDSDGDSDDSEAKRKNEKALAEMQDAQEEKENSAAVPIQGVVRRFMARVHFKQRLEEAIKAAEGFAGDQKTEILEKKQKVLLQRAGRVAHEQFTRCYVEDLLANTSLYLVQKTAVTTIQKNWRGHRVRRRFYLQWVRSTLPPRQPRSRYTPQVARRVWARKDYIPDGGWPGQKWSTIEYDIHEHADIAPKGRDFGVKTRKVQLPAKLQRNREIVMNDHNSWVGIPVNVEPSTVIERRAQMLKQELALLEGVSPYVGPQFQEIKVKPKPLLKGETAVRAMGWTEKMIDRRKPPPGGKRAYSVIDPYSSAALAADLATVTIREPSANATQSKQLALGSSLDQASVGSLEKRGGSNGSNKQQGSIGMGVWNGSIEDKGRLPLMGQQHSRETSQLLTHTAGSVVQLVTPVRGSVKPLSGKHMAALKQAQLLPDDLEQRYALEQIRASGLNETDRERRSKRRRRDEKMAEEVAMHDPSKWTKTIGGQLRVAAYTLAHDINEDQAPLKAADEDPWSRSTYAPKMELPSRVLVWPKKPKESYKVKYSWLPQTMVKNAAVSVYNDLREEQGKGMRSGGRGFHKATSRKRAMPDHIYAEAMALKRAQEAVLALKKQY